MTEDTKRRLARAMAAGRVLLGAGALAAPGATGRAWLGEDRPATRLMLRGMGARDVALGAGLARALRGGGDVRGWLASGALADAGDLVAALAAARSLDRRVTLVGLGAAVAAALGVALAAAAPGGAAAGSAAERP